MENSQIKIILSGADGAYVKDIKSQVIEGLDGIRFSNNLGGGQGEVDLEVRERYDSADYAEKQIVEIAFYDGDNVSGSLRYAGFIKNLNRKYSQVEGDSIGVEILGLGSLLGEYDGAFSFTGNLNAAIDAFVSQFRGVCDISVPLEFVGSHIIKNGVSATTAVSVNLTGTYFDMLKGIFDSITKTFFIDTDGTINLGDQSTAEHLLTINKDIVDLRIASSRETEITLVGDKYEIAPGDKIFILNVNADYNMEGSRVEKVEYKLTETKLYLGNVWSLGTDILRN